MSETQRIFNALRQLVRALRLNSSRIEDHTNLTGAQAFVLQKIAPGEALTVNEIGTRTQTDQSSVSVVIKKLTAKKLVSKKRDPKDQRKFRISLTSKGAAHAGKTMGLIQDRLLSAIDSLTNAEQKKLSVLLQKLNRLTQIDQEPTTLFFEDERPQKHGT